MLASSSDAFPRCGRFSAFFPLLFLGSVTVETTKRSSRSQLHRLSRDHLTIKRNARAPFTCYLPLLYPRPGYGQIASGNERLVRVGRNRESSGGLLVKTAVWHQHFELLNVVSGRHVFPGDVDFDVAHRRNTERSGRGAVC